MAHKKQLSESSEVAFESSEPLSSQSKPSSLASHPATPLISSRSFRKVRGANIQKLLARENLNEEVDDFWLQNKYFGKINNFEESDEEYEKESSIKDVFDSDFFSGSEEENKNFFLNPEEENEEKLKKTLEKQKKTISKNFNESIVKKVFIHEFFSQEELLKEAALTEILNKKSLEDLVRIEEEKKKKNVFQRMKTDSPKMKLIDSCKAGFPQKIFLFTDEEALDEEFKWIRGKENSLDRAVQMKEITNENKTNQKYREPQTKERFTTIEEFKNLRKKIFKGKRSRLKFQLKGLKSLLEKKQQALASFS